MSLLGIVPARGGSKRLRRKNLLPLAGKSLVLHAAENLSEVCDRVVISTDDVEIVSVALSHGFEVHKREPVDDGQTVAECARLVVDDLGWDGDVLLLQPTVPYPGDLQDFVDRGRERGYGWGSAGGVPFTRFLSVPTDIHEPTLMRTGLYYWPALDPSTPAWKAFSSDEVHMVVMDPSAGLDIDTVEDYHTAVLRADRKKILIEYVESVELGTGHRWRAETLAAALQHHAVTLFDVNSLGGVSVGTVDMVITDTLDSDETPFGDQLWVTFEDHGKAAHQADLVVNALYSLGPTRFDKGYARWGPEWAVLRPEFMSLPPYTVRDLDGELPRVLLMFGGTDPSNLTDLAIHAIGHMPHFRNPPGAPFPVAAVMQDNDILITSAGRTVYEAAAVGIPTIVMAQNNREATHVHLGPSHGNIYLGLGRLVTAEVLRHTVEQVADDKALRQELSDTARASIDGKGLQRIVHAIDGLLEGL